MARPFRPRRGVVLLIVIILLTLLLVTGLTFAVLSGQFRRGAEAAARKERYGMPPEKLLDRAMYQLLRDTNDRTSSLAGHSLLADLYGNDGVRGMISSGSTPALAAGGEFIEFQAENDVLQPFNRTLSLDVQAYTGCVLTMLNGPAAGLSTRVVAYTPSAGSAAVVRVEAFDSDVSVPILPNAQDRFIINGHPFNGTGFGYLPNLQSKNLDAVAFDPGPDRGWGTIGVDDDSNSVVDDWTEAGLGDDVPLPAALLPHFRGHAIPTRYAIDIGGSDEGYDAPDYQNMLLAMVKAAANSSDDIIPSLHRPELVNYWSKYQGGALWNSASGDLRRKAVFRPMPWDHRSFSGSNPKFDPSLSLAELTNNLITGTSWDVDNDGDGIADSVWVDVGFPIQTSPDGRKYRPLVAILCQDLDGRLNLNAHSQLVAFDVTPLSLPNIYSTIDSGTHKYRVLPVSFPFSSTPSVRLPRGLGIGPAEVHLGPVFSEFFGDQVQNNEALATVMSRNGFDQLMPGRDNSNDDPLSAVKNPGLPYDYATQYSDYGSPPDTRGLGAVGLDPAGQPYCYYMGTPPGETLNDPYEMLLHQNGVGDEGPEDAPFTMAELERLLRYYDADAASLPDRLLRVAPNTFMASPDAQQRRALVTSMSSHVPSPAVFLPKWFRAPNSSPPPGQYDTDAQQRIIGSWNKGRDGQWGRADFDDDNKNGTDDAGERGWPGSDDTISAPNLVGMYRAKLLANGVSESDIPGELDKIVPFELFHGEKLNINRLLGNGVDDNGNDVVDEPYETQSSGDLELAWGATSAAPPTFKSVPFNGKNDDPLVQTDQRQMLARHLYCLMMLLVDQGYVHPIDPTSEPGLSDPAKSELTIMRIAQWAINVVDFRDADAIMTPFEYDINPFDGWQVNLPGNPTDQRRLVWGAEYPDLLLTETFAFHDRRVKDTADDTSGRKRDDSATEDDDLDQYRIPQGSLYLELYCPRNQATNNKRFPRELYDDNGMLDLGRVSPDGMPVWRVMISEQQPANPANMPRIRAQRDGGGLPHSTSFNPVEQINPATSAYDLNWSYNMNLLSQLKGTQPLASDRLPAERFVWLAPVAPPLAGDGLKTYWCRNFAPGAGPRLAPGGYAVVGPRAYTPIGSSNDHDPGTFCDPSPQRILLDGGVFQQWDIDGVDRYGPGVGVNYRPAVSIICAAHLPTAPNAPNPWNNPQLQTRGIGLSVSEPLPNGGFYYPEPTYVYDPLDGFPDGYDEPDPTKRTNRLTDEPFDNDSNRPLGTGDLQKTGTKFDFKAAFLQRLANPLMPYHITGNPYITVDWATIDLTVFNGEDQWVARTAQANPWDPQDPDPQDPIHFSTRQRGLATLTTPAPMYGANLVLPPAADYTLWSPSATPPVRTQVVPNPVSVGGVDWDHFFQHNISHTLGFLNGTMGPTLPAQNLGSPQRPFPWLTWNNRPFATPLEAMLVSCSSPSRLLHEYTNQDPTPPTPPPPPDLYNPANFGKQYGHLLSFFNSAQEPDKAAHFYALFDYIGTPSPYVGTEKWYNPTYFFDNDLNNPTNNLAAITFRPPFNRLSRFRDPGRININTVSDPRVIEGIMKAFPAMDDPAAMMAAHIFQSRQGYSAADFLALNDDYPTRFANPFRSSDGADLAPPTTANMRKEGIDATLLRRRLESSVPLFDATSTDDVNNTNRNPYFRYQGIERLGNILSTTSNVYAVWITIGYFEVEPNPTGPDAAHPDGYQLGRELGSDAGTVKRHRAFYIIDRSIPVAFEPGENHNVDRAVLLRRFIE